LTLAFLLMSFPFSPVAFLTATARHPVMSGCRTVVVRLRG
jgi:hypothetical protein